MKKEKQEFIKNAFRSPIQGLLKIEGHSAFVYRVDNFFGVAIENKYDVQVNETFSNVIFKTEKLVIRKNKEEENVIILITDLITHIDEFSLFCMDFISNDNIEKIQKSPLEWWKKWKELIGNRSHNPQPYELIAELHALYSVISNNEKNINWGGLDGSTIDFTTNDNYYEVKSSIVRYENEITISSQYQLSDKSKPQILLYYKVEKLEGGESIDSILAKMTNKLSKENELLLDIEKKLEQKGYPKNSSSRKAEYVIHEIRKYNVDEKFPRITKESFKNGQIPANIKKIYYVINLDNLEYEILKMVV